MKPKIEKIRDALQISVPRNRQENNAYLRVSIEATPQATPRLLEEDYTSLISMSPNQGRVESSSIDLSKKRLGLPWVTMRLDKGGNQEIYYGYVSRLDYKISQKSKPMICSDYRLYKFSPLMPYLTGNCFTLDLKEGS
jgi:hypothetical protein